VYGAVEVCVWGGAFDAGTDTAKKSTKKAMGTGRQQEQMNTLEISGVQTLESTDPA
jgi:hypothetical protein